MALKTKTGLSSEKAKEFAKVFEQLIYRHSSWKVWQDFVDLCAISISNAVDKREAVWETREKAYMSIKGSYTDDEFSVFVSLFSITIHALEDNPAQDFLGELYMKLNFGNGWKGQFFTPFHISEMMARMTIGENTQDEIKKKGYIVDAFDMDDDKNEHVLRGHRNLAWLAAKYGFSPKRVTWDRKYKGIDDYLLAVRNLKGGAL